MFDPTKIFENFLNEHNITPTRLVLFGNDNIGKLQSQNTGGIYDTLIALVSSAIDDLDAEIGDVDVAITIQKGKTLTVDGVVADFKKAMSDKEGTIADKLGGRGTAAYLQFYPHGISEYSAAAKVDLPTLMGRVRVAAIANAVALGTPLSDLLKAYDSAYSAARTEQETQFGTVESDRSDRDTKLLAAQLALLVCIHTIGAKFPGDTVKCMSFFDFSLLFATSHHSSVTKSGSIAPGGIALIANKSFTDTNKINVKNTDDNADFIIYLAATETAEPGASGVTVKPGKGKNPKPSTLGSLTNTFLLIKNTSLVNDGSYVVKIS